MAGSQVTAGNVGCERNENCKGNGGGVWVVRELTSYMKTLTMVEELGQNGWPTGKAGT